MVKSMTAFSRAESTGTEGHLVWEIRSVNHRYLELTFRLPEELRRLEPSLRERVKQSIARGKVEITAKFKPTTGNKSALKLNTTLVEQLLQAAQEVRKLALHTTEINPTEILAWPNVLTPPEPNFDQLQQEALGAFDAAVTLLIKGREQEGKALQQLVSDKTQGIVDLVNTITSNFEQIIEQQQTKLKGKIEELNVKVDEERLEQELLYIIQKLDVTEEIDRLNTHCRELNKILLKNSPIGRRLDFLLQEMNRETNTIGSKISDSQVTQSVVEIKVLIEQIREQIQNIE